MGYRASGRHRHDPCRLRPGCSAAPRAARAGGRGYCTASAHRRDHQRHRGACWTWLRTPFDRACPGRRFGTRRRLRRLACRRPDIRRSPPMIHPFVRVHLNMLAVATFGIANVLTTPALAAGSNMPWEQPLQQILQSIEGPVSKIVAVIIIIVTGLTLAFGDTAGGFRRLIQIVFGLSIAFAASSFFLSFFSFAGGALV